MVIFTILERVYQQHENGNELLQQDALSIFNALPLQLKFCYLIAVKDAR